MLTVDRAEQADRLVDALAAVIVDSFTPEIVSLRQQRRRAELLQMLHPAWRRAARFSLLAGDEPGERLSVVVRHPRLLEEAEVEGREAP